jgi:phage pi2 protein 07
VKFKVGDRVVAWWEYASEWTPGTILRIPGYAGQASVRLDKRVYHSDTDAHSFDFKQMRHFTKLEKYLYGELDTPQQKE